MATGTRAPIGIATPRRIDIGLTAGTQQRSALTHWFESIGVFIRVILFLDFDGVLHPDPCFEEQRLFERAPMLAQVLDHFAEVSLVLSTSWRTQYDVNELVALLPAILRPRIVGVTPLFSAIRPEPGLAPYRREAECRAWLAASDQHDRNWLALDDRASLFTPYCEHLVCCESSTGLTEATIAHLFSHCSRNRVRMAQHVDTLL